MNMLVADSGASKTDWVLLHDGDKQFIQTEGLNPHIVSPSQFLNTLSKELKPNLMGKSISRIQFYGSGCGSPQKKENVRSFLREVFPGVKVDVKTDLDGAGLALFSKRQGIVCILGTGSSAGFFKENAIDRQMPSLGYPLGDEGSGSYIGKEILVAYLEGRLHKDLRVYLEEQLKMDLDEIFAQVQTPEMAKLFVSRLCKLMSKKSYHPEMQNILDHGFCDFLNKVKEHFPEESAAHQLGFVGSIASVYEAELRACAKQMGLEISSVIRTPIEHIAFHFSR
ncbi:hypothetical protein [Gracilimonas mengyeensis]|nr:hypothetical protein [Gracilimonas mengyeensis]